MHVCSMFSDRPQKPGIIKKTYDKCCTAKYRDSFERKLISLFHNVLSKNAAITV